MVYFFISRGFNRLIENDAWFQLENRCERDVIISLSPHCPNATTTNDDKNTSKSHTKWNDDIYGQ